MRHLIIIIAIVAPGCVYVPSSVDTVPDVEVINRELRLPTVLSEFAKALEHDGTLDSPKAISTQDIAVLLDLTLEYSFRGTGAYTQDVADHITSSLESLEPDGESVDLDEATRARAVNIINELAEGLHNGQ